MGTALGLFPGAENGVKIIPISPFPPSPGVEN